MSSSAQDQTQERGSVLRTLVVAPIKVWSNWISPGLPRRCKYEPTCSHYATQAIEEMGIIRGLVLAGWRLLRCNPWSHGGFDPVAANGLFDAHGKHDTHPHSGVQNL